MPDPPKPDLEKILQAHRSLKRYRSVSEHERLHRIIIAALAIIGFLGYMFFGHLRLLLPVAVIYFIVAVWTGSISFRGRRFGGQGGGEEERESDFSEDCPPK